MTMTTRMLAFTAGLTLVSAPLAAQGGLTPEQATGMRQLSNVRISPDGRWVAYTLSVPDLKTSSMDADIWLVPAQGGAAVRLTAAKGMDDQPRWSSDGRWIGFVSTRDGKPQVYRISPTGGEAEKLTDSKTGVQSFMWAPEGNRLAYVAPRDPTPAEEKKQKDKDDAIVVDQGFIAARLSVFDLGTRKATEVVRGDYQIIGMDWSPDGKQIAYTAMPTPRADDSRRTDVMIVDLASGTTRKLIDNDGPDGAPSWSPDGSWIAFETKGPKAISDVVDCVTATVNRVGRRYLELGLDHALFEDQRPGQTPLLNSRENQRIIAMVCGPPPEGRATWTTQLIAEEAVKKRICQRVSRETIRILLLSHDLKPWREKNVVRGGTR